jgi:acetyl-CoA carboxylase biotin carboxylase subunit
VELKGHAIECRVYAEDPENNFLPSPGKITRLRVPSGNGVRDDSGIYQGSEISIFYDPMISKFCVYGRDREEALGRLKRALQEYEVGGIKTTLPFFREIIEDEEFQQGKLDTSFIARWQERRKKQEANETEKDLAIIAAALNYSQAKPTQTVQTQQTESRWQKAGRLAMHASRL